MDLAMRQCYALCSYIGLPHNDSEVRAIEDDVLVVPDTAEEDRPTPGKTEAAAGMQEVASTDEFVAAVELPAPEPLCVFHAYFSQAKLHICPAFASQYFVHIKWMNIKVASTLVVTFLPHYHRIRQPVKSASIISKG
ncbi:hypothetical protein SETIT_9G377400v2 [Setaria italica]|uniref:Uncharacterized protein n=2 Tax=Setaria TaxID=4554 RepID=A0A368SQ47_SETIT|nr:hypothetical protein SETIT_9G377400v2 [Setaria italica]TKV95752.1 hypothetical protein SEVIR_9G382700v2 [Setaria viridis]TKV95753.1 hypothetical protein SEVIR_9G382700v2 [Setaria viridis]